MSLRDFPDVESMSPVQEKIDHHYGGQAQVRSHGRRVCITIIPWLTLTLLFVIAVSGFGHEYFTIPVPATTQASVGDYNCGSSIAEAKAKGCLFDVMAYAWVPAPCFNGDLLDTYDAYGMSPWASDENLTEPVSKETLFAGGARILYTDLRFHQEHCFYTWHNLLHTVEHRRPLIHNLSASTEHRLHCKGLFLHGDVPTGPVFPALFHCVDMREVALMKENLYWKPDTTDEPDHRRRNSGRYF